MTKKGGDIDILIRSSKIRLDEKLKIRKYIFRHMEEQKIDLVITRDFEEPFAEMARDQGILPKVSPSLLLHRGR